MFGINSQLSGIISNLAFIGGTLRDILSELKSLNVGVRAVFDDLESIESLLHDIKEGKRK